MSAIESQIRRATSILFESASGVLTRPSFASTGSDPHLASTRSACAVDATSVRAETISADDDPTALPPTALSEVLVVAATETDATPPPSPPPSSPPAADDAPAPASAHFTRVGEVRGARPAAASPLPPTPEERSGGEEGSAWKGVGEVGELGDTEESAPSALEAMTSDEAERSHPPPLQLGVSSTSISAAGTSVRPSGSDSGATAHRAGSASTGEAKPGYFLLLLNRETFMESAGDTLASDVHALMAQGIAPILIHDQRQPSAGGVGAPVEFDRFFHVTPYDLIKDGLYHSLATPLHGGSHQVTSLSLIAKQLNAIQRRERRGARMSLPKHSMTAQSTKLSSVSTLAQSQGKVDAP